MAPQPTENSLMAIETARTEAIKKGHKTYQGLGCKEGHLERYVTTKSCVECNEEHLRKTWGMRNFLRWKSGAGI